MGTEQNTKMSKIDTKIENVTKRDGTLAPFDENKIYIEMAYKIWQTILRSIFKDLGEYSLYEILNYLRIRDFNRAALGCGIISVTDSLDEFYISLQKSLLVDDKSCLKDIDIVLRRINNGY